MKYILLFIVGISFGPFSFSQNYTKTIRRLPDSGQTKSFTNTFGEDQDYASNMPFFIDHGNGTITDTITGLMWQKIDFGEISFENAVKYCDTLTLGGYTDWRLPSPLEGFSILNLQNTNPAINTTFFPKSAAEYWWTNKLQYNDPSKVWVTNSGGGIGNHLKTETISAGGTKNFFVRAVRDVNTPSILPNRYISNGDGTITDLVTHLVWQQTPEAQVKTWEDALVYAEGLTFASKSDWRLPSIRELQSINDENFGSPSVNNSFFHIVNTERKFWSSTTLIAKDATKAWFWDTQFGITTYDLKTVANYVLCVRDASESEVASVNALSDTEISFFPNPSNTQIYIQTNTDKEQKIKLFNAFGQLMTEKTIQTTDFSISVSDFPEGYYVLEWTDATSSKRYPFTIVHP